MTFNPDALRKEFADYCADVEPGIKAKAPKLNQLETLALIGMTLFQAAKELKAEKAELADRIAALESAAKATVLTYHEYESLLAFATRIEEAQEKPIEVSVHASALLRRLATAPAATDNGGGWDAWISVDERLPEEGQDVAFIVHAAAGSIQEHLNGRVLGGKFLTVGRYPTFTVPGLGFNASHWQPLPAAPAALSQKAGEQDD